MIVALESFKGTKVGVLPVFIRNKLCSISHFSTILPWLIVESSPHHVECALESTPITRGTIAKHFKQITELLRNCR